MTDRRYRDEEWLRRRYHEEGATQYEIAEELEVSQSLISKKFRQFDIQARDHHGAQGISPNCPLRDEDWLREMYVEQEKSTHAISDMLNVTNYCVRTFLNKHSIPTRDVVGENHPQWKGGSKAYGSGWNESKRRQVRERDGYECVSCGTTQDEHKAEYNQTLHVHHLIKARDIDDPEERNAAENLVTLCLKCHNKWEQLSEAGIRPEINQAAAD
jgi:5-methylcytosine-specific restriction endonuclease McrA